MKKLHFIFLFIFFIPALSFSFGLFNTGFWKKNGGNDSNINLLLHGDGSGTSIVDSSSRKHTVTSNNGATQSTAQSKFGGSSIYFDGTSDYLTIPDSEDWSFGLSDFTIDFWIRFTDSTTPDVILHQENDANNTWYLYHNGTSQVLELINAVGGVATINHTISWAASPNSWYHIAVIRFGNEFKTFINGTQVGATTVDSDGWNNNTGLLYIGANAASNHSVAGYIDELRISKGVARWTSNFTPPAYPAGMNELTCPTSYIRVPALSGYTTSDFCVAKYEMKNNGGAKSEAAGTPWVSIARGTDATTAGGAWKACRDIGAGYDLISNAQWQTIARNIADQNANWSNGNAASGTTGQLNRGHSDNVPANSLAASTDDNNSCYGTGEEASCSSTIWNSQRRTHTLSNGNVIWDFAGNVWEWVQDNNTSSQGADGYISTFTDGRQATYGNDTFCSAPSTSPYCGMGHGWTSSSAGAVLRGGYWFNGVNTGVFAANLTYASSDTGALPAFRCVFSSRFVTTSGYFNSSSSTYLSRSPAAGNRTKWTFSAWIKIGDHSTQRTIIGARNGNSNQGSLALQADGSFLYLDHPGGYQANIATVEKINNFSTWHHVLLSVDTTLSTAAERVKIYLDGQLLTHDPGFLLYHTQNYNTVINSTMLIRIGAFNITDGSLSEQWDGYMAEIHFVDGQALGPNKFINETSAPVEYTGSHGSTGFYLKFESGAIATDSSGLGNNFTNNNGVTSNPQAP